MEQAVIFFSDFKRFHTYEYEPTLCLTYTMQTVVLKVGLMLWLGHPKLSWLAWGSWDLVNLSHQDPKVFNCEILLKKKANKIKEYVAYNYRI